MPWYYAVAERDHHIQNPISEAKIRLLGEYLRLTATDRVLDVACGRGGPAVILAKHFGCRIVGVERAHEFASVARERVGDLAGLVEVVERDAQDFPLEAEGFDAALCLGATFVWDGLDGTLEAMTPAVRPGGHVVVGEPYWNQWPLPEDVDDLGYVDLRGTMERIASAGLHPTGLIAASDDDWDAYESLHWRAVEDWLHQHPDDPEADDLRAEDERHRRAYVDRRALRGWAIFVARKRGG
jgi:SAM-dependent methyltransferase